MNNVHILFHDILAPYAPKDHEKELRARSYGMTVHNLQSTIDCMKGDFKEDRETFIQSCPQILQAFADLASLVHEMERK